MYKLQIRSNSQSNDWHDSNMLGRKMTYTDAKNARAKLNQIYGWEKYRVVPTSGEAKTWAS